MRDKEIKTTEKRLAIERLSRFLFALALSSLLLGFFLCSLFLHQTNKKQLNARRRNAVEREFPDVIWRSRVLDERRSRAVDHPEQVGRRPGRRRCRCGSGSAGGRDRLFFINDDVRFVGVSGSGDMTQSERS